MPITDYLAPLSIPGAAALIFAGFKIRSEIEERNNNMALRLAEAADKDAADARKESEELRALVARLRAQLVAAGLEPVQ